MREQKYLAWCFARSWFCYHDRDVMQPVELFTPKSLNDETEDEENLRHYMNLFVPIIENMVDYPVSTFDSDSKFENGSDYVGFFRRWNKSYLNVKSDRGV